METLQIRFRSSRRADPARAEDALDGYLAALSKNGQILGDALTARAGNGYVVFATVPKYFGTSAARERRRVCPSCKRRWALASALHGIFDFQYNRCRLVSNVAFDVRSTAV